MSDGFMIGLDLLQSAGAGLMLTRCAISSCIRCYDTTVHEKAEGNTGNGSENAATSNVESVWYYRPFRKAIPLYSMFTSKQEGK